MYIILIIIGRLTNFMCIWIWKVVILWYSSKYNSTPMCVHIWNIGIPKLFERNNILKFYYLYLCDTDHRNITIMSAKDFIERICIILIKKYLFNDTTSILKYLFFSLSKCEIVVFVAFEEYLKTLRITQCIFGCKF